MPGRSELLSATGKALALRAEEQDVVAIIETEGAIHLVWSGVPDDLDAYQLARAKVERHQNGERLLVGREHHATRALIREIYEAAGLATQSGFVIDRDRYDVEIDEMLVMALKRRASDVHLQVDERETRVLMRCDGDLIRVMERSRAWGEEMSRALFTRGKHDTKDVAFRPTEEQGLSIERVLVVPGQADPVRLNLRFASGPVYPEGWDVVLRVLHLGLDAKSVSMPNLGYEPQMVNAITGAIEEVTGLTVLVGATGSGKSTTIKTLCEMIDTRYAGRKLIRTIEDPPEYRIRGARQGPVVTSNSPEEQRKNFIAALRGAMRKDPDTIVVGEVRDNASAELAQQAAQTGHRVLATLHASGLAEAISRFHHLGMSLDVLGSEGFLQAVIRQALVKCLCPECAVPLHAGKGVVAERVAAPRKRLEALNVDLSAVRVTGPGCAKCGGTGGYGRTVVAEVLVPDWQMLDLISKGDFLSLKAYWRAQQALSETAAERAGGQTMREHTVMKVLRGEVCPLIAEEDVGVIGRERSVAEALDILLARGVISAAVHKEAAAKERRFHG